MNDGVAVSHRSINIISAYVHIHTHTHTYIRPLFDVVKRRVNDKRCVLV